MNVGLKLLSGSAFLVSAEAVSHGCMFLRNMILARLLSKEDFGIAATLALVISFFELAGKMSFGQQIIQSKEGDDPMFQKSSHASQALAGLASAALILGFAYPISRWFGTEAHWQSLMLLCIIPLCTGFASLDVNRLARHFRFAPLALTELAPQVLITLAAWPLAVWLRDYRAILYLLLFKAGLSLAGSHALSERAYRLCWRPDLMRENLRFGGPLLVSGYLMFAIFQGDRLLVAGAYSLSDLGVYAVASTLAMAPCMVIFKVSGMTALPVLARAQNDDEQFRRHFCVLAQGLALSAALLVVVMILAGENLITLLFGAKYQEATALTIWLVIGQAFRILRGATTCAAMAKGDTANSLLANLWRLSGLLLVAPVILLKLDLRWVAVAGGAGEVLALLASLLRLRKKHGLPPGDCLYPAALMLGLTILAFLAKELLALSHPAGILILAVLGGAVSLAAFGWMFADLRQVSFSLLAEIKARFKKGPPVYANLD